MQVLHLTEHGFYDLHIGVYDCQILVVRRLFIHFFKDFLVIPIKKSDIVMSKTYKSHNKPQSS